jgi:hypothetical protein
LGKFLFHSGLLACMNQPKALSAIEVRHVFVTVNLNVDIMVQLTGRIEVVMWAGKWGRRSFRLLSVASEYERVRKAR